jgi:hypothetical protein
MRTNFSLVFLTVNSLFVVAANSSFADLKISNSTGNNASLSRTICKLIDLDRESYCLVEMAVDRASVAKGIQPDESPTMDLPEVPATQPVDKQPQTKPDSQPTDKSTPKPIVNDSGQVIIPRRNYIIGARG